MGIATSLLVGAGASLLGSMNASDAAENAASTQAQSAADANALQKQMYDQTRADQTPWREAGTNALAQMTTGTRPGGAYMKPFGMSDFTADPGYSFRMSEGLKALDRSAAARGGLLSGSTLKGAQRYGQDLASQEYQAAYNRYNTNQSGNFNRLATMAGVGQTANNQVGAAGQNYANNVGSNIMGAGNAQAAGMVGSANAWNNGISQGVSMYNTNNMLNRFFPQQTGWENFSDGVS